MKIEVREVSRVFRLMKKPENLSFCLEVIFDLFEILGINRIVYSREIQRIKDQLNFVVTLGRGPKVMIQGTHFKMRFLEENKILYTPTDKFGHDVLYRIVRPDLDMEGLLALDDTSRARKFSDEEKKDLAELIELFVEVYSAKTNFDKHRRAADEDFLTGIWNRRMFIEEFSEAIRNVANKRFEHSCVAVLDIDNFKKINDQYGHEVGDKALKNLGSILLQFSKDNDCFVARYGGEEFVIILENQDLNSAFKKLEEIRAEVQNLVINANGKGSFNFTFSAGLIEINNDLISSFRATEGCPDVISFLFDLVDTAMYRAKREGKNCIRY